MREEVRAQSGYRSRILATRPAPESDLDAMSHPDAHRAADRMDARLAAMDPVSAAGTAPAPESSTDARQAASPPELLERVQAHLHAQAADARRADDALEARAHLIRPATARQVAAATADPSVATPAEAGARAVAALGGRGLPREREQVAALAAAAWEARARLDRLTDRAAELLEMRRTLPGARTTAYEVLREVERRRDEIARAELGRAALRDPSLLPRGEGRMQEGGRFQDVRSIDCLRCGTTAAREDGRSRLQTDGTPKLDEHGEPERYAPRDGELCTPCYLASGPMSVPELKLAQRQARNLEAAQVRFRPGRTGWSERAEGWTEQDRVRRGLADPLDERLDAPSPFVVQPSPAEAADRRVEELLEREWQREEAAEKGRWDEPGDREAEWWETKFAGAFSDEPEPRPEPSPERRVQLETARLAEAQRRLRSVVGVEDPGLRRVLETQANVRLHLAQGGAVRDAWERTRGVDRAELRAAAREQVARQLMEPAAMAHQRRLREARGMALPREMPLEMQAAIRARQVERILADLDVPTLVRRVEELRGTAARPETVRAARELHDRLQPALADPRLQGAVAAGQLAETARQERGVFHSGLDEAVLTGERRGELHERTLDRWLEADGPGDVRSARDLAREAGELNPRRETQKHFPEKERLPWKLAARDAAIAGEMGKTGYAAPERILAAVEAYRAEVREGGVPDPFGSEVRDRITEAAARQAGFTSDEVGRLWEIRALEGVGVDTAGWDELLREAGAWTGGADPGHEIARLRAALEDLRRDEVQLAAPAAAEREKDVSPAPGRGLSEADRALLARAEQAAAPYLDVLYEYRAAWLAHDASAAPAAAAEPPGEEVRHPAVRAAMDAHADPEIARLAGQLAALEEFERLDAPYQEAVRHADRAQTLVDATREAREAARQSWASAEQTIRAQFSHADRLVERVRGMDAAEVRELAASLRKDPLALSSNHPRSGGAPRIPGINAAGTVERLEPHLKTVRAQGLRGLLGQADRSATERQAQVAAVALETWAEVRQRGDELRAWAVSQLALPADTPLAQVHEAAVDRLAELRTSHRDLVQSWQAVSPPPTRGQIERSLRSMDPATAARARQALPGLAPPPQPSPPPRPEPALATPAMSR
jgi:hypothetical protein